MPSWRGLYNLLTGAGTRRVGRFTRHLVLGVAVFAGGTWSVWAGSANIIPIADTTLSENYPSNNFGGLTYVHSGTTGNLTRNRGLFKFDIAGSMPAGAVVQSARLVVEVVQQSIEAQPFADYGLYRLLRPWGEGTNSSSGGMGSPALTNQAIWYYRFAYTTNSWSAPGAGATNDAVSVPSAVQTIYGVNESPFMFGPEPGMTADVQFWLDHPQSNFGWLLLCHAESTPYTARRFAGREDSNRAPQLAIDYLIRPRIDVAQAAGNQFSLSFLAQPGQGYVVQFRDGFSAGTWQPLATIGAQAEVVRVLVVDSHAVSRRFYRVMTY